ncbi:hypothetical protein [Methanocaldococcus sp.]
MLVKANEDGSYDHRCPFFEKIGREIAKKAGIYELMDNWTVWDGLVYLQLVEGLPFGIPEELTIGSPARDLFEEMKNSQNKEQTENKTKEGEKEKEIEQLKEEIKRLREELEKVKQTQKEENEITA